MARRALAWLAAAIGAVMVLGMLSLAVPFERWRTGELPAPPLPVVAGGPAVSMPQRLWVDADAACGQGRTTDPDDCFALLLLARADETEIAGVSTVFGNAPLPVTDRVAGELLARLRREGTEAPRIHRGSAEPLVGTRAEPAHEALRAALAQGPLTILALGPLTNVAAALRGRPDLQSNVARLVTVMGRRPGHLFHPGEGAGRGMLRGHGPVFRDFNFDKDREAARVVLAMGLPITLVPYAAAREMHLTAADLDQLERQGGTSAWVAAGSRAWLDFWRKDVGQPGFYPFDLVAAAYFLWPRSLDCAHAQAWIAKDERLRNILVDPDALLAGLPSKVPDDRIGPEPVVFCTGLGEWLHGRIMQALLGE